ncbi:thiamine-phosphate synthase [Clostridium tepidiprofundi DSM 19306]|uniref:Thiamine-phosphate synthase n=1 Tax=Clostridium tepidiprofundi DSM 19306 TaxID=1121338 RepID=A0A151ASQ6_9CLOT|nr:thiamine phosphate synthase [Clostridium tepidiprofundi]KYH30610.1 thiamine-phosphate synthase [Clostridium tepidiprofundi DSM 19306]
MNVKTKVDYSLYLVTDREILGERDLIKSIEDAILGGATLIQLREKNISTLNFYKIALKVKELTTRNNIPLIINDRLDIVLAVDAEGLHIGQDDMPLEIARNILGEDKIIGLSTSTLDEAIEAEKNGADYIGVGAMFPTSTKQDAKSVTLDELRTIKEAVNIPVVGIGGINKSNILSLMETGVDGAAIISAILGEKNIRQTCKDFKEMIINR